EEDVSYTLEFRMRHTAQNWVWYLMEGAMMRNMSDIPYRMVGRLKNIDDIKVGQKRLVAEESIRQTLIDVSYDGYWDWHVQDDYEYISPRFWQLLQCDPSDYDHSPSEWKKYIIPEDEKILQQVLDAHIYSLGYKAFQCELHFRRKDGQIATLLCKGQVIEWDEHGRPLRVIRVHTDISEIKDAYLMQEELISKLNASNEELERFAYVASHDLKEPLRMVKCYAELIKEKYEALLDDKGQKYINYAYSGAVQMQEMIDDLLEYARLSSNNAEYHPEIVNMDDIIAHVLKNLDYAITASGANIKWYNIPDCVIGHPLKLVCVFQNLISNAIKYQAKGNIPEITITADNVDDKILFEVKDNGIGMNPDYVQRIFEPFKRLHNKKAYAGTGIGLAICRKAVENMSGTIWAEAEEGLGSTFYIALPQPEQFEDFLDEKYVA
ncbi:MAG: ATP-binding protein, partial [Pseudomonadota bacterium]